MGAFKFSLILLGLRILLWLQATRYSAFRKRLKEKNFSAQMRTNDGSVGRWFVFKDIFRKSIEDYKFARR